MDFSNAIVCIATVSSILIVCLTLTQTHGSKLVTSFRTDLRTFVQETLAEQTPAMPPPRPAQNAPIVEINAAPQPQLQPGLFSPPPAL
jgi:hypothetical protein